MPSKTAVFTIASLNYGAYVHTLMESVLKVHPEWDRHVLLVDRCADPAAVGGALFTSTLVEDLPLPDKQAFLFRYDILELNTAVKPYMCAQLRQQGYERIIYIDPDILLLDRLVDVEQLLDQGHTAVVTPHLTAPITDNLQPTELDIMRAGSFNLGFIAIGAGAAADAFIAWWQQKLEFGALSDMERGLFTDQKWVDMAPGMFGGFAILRDPGYNVAYWNITQRPVTKENDVWMAGGSRLRFFHFSGFDPANPAPFSKHQNRVSLSSIGVVSELALSYAAMILSHGHETLKKIPYAFGAFADGTPIPGAIRALYREDVQIRAFAGAHPDSQPEVFTQSESQGLPTILRALWLQQQHLQRAFPDPLGASRLAYHRWFVETGAGDLRMPPAFIAPVKRAYNHLTGMAKLQAAQKTPRGTPLLGRALIGLHKRATGGRLGPARMLQYQQIRNPAQFVKLGLQQFRQSRWAGRFGLTSAVRPPLNSMQSVVAMHTHGQITRPLPAWKGTSYSGLYAEHGKEVWWVGIQAQFNIDHLDANVTSVRLRGIHHGDVYPSTATQQALKIGVYFNDATPVVISVPNGPFDVSVELGNLPGVWPAILHIVPQSSHVPSEAGYSSDDRRLSFQLASVTIGDEEIFRALPSTTSTALKIRRVLPDSQLQGVNVIGYARSEHGVGQSLRQFVSALDAEKIACSVVDFNHNNPSRVNDGSLGQRITSDPKFIVNVLHINADQIPEVEHHLPKLLAAHYNIGFWHWELPEMNEEHLCGFNPLHEVWVPTAFVQEAVAKKSPLPVVRMPHAIHFSVSPDASRAQFKLPENKFLFLLMYDFSSYQARKNPEAALAAFERAFEQNNSNAVLVIKTQNAQLHDRDVQQLSQRIAGRTDVIWINETLTRQQVYDLQSVCDALVSLHRSEGYGLGPAEAMFLGKPVIATNWSGNTEFMRPDNSLPVNYRLVKIAQDIGVYRAGQVWAEPDVEHAATLMRQIVSDAGLRTRISVAAKRTMQEEFSPAVIGKRIQARLEFIRHNLL